MVNKDVKCKMVIKFSRKVSDNNFGNFELATEVEFNQPLRDWDELSDMVIDLVEEQCDKVVDKYNKKRK